ncbi:MAG: AAA family ATPase [Phycisphaerales bacterium]
MRTIAIVNQKGGCGKTTTAINLAAVCAKRGLRTLLVDIDPQSHCAAGLGVPEDAIEHHIGSALVANLDRGFSRSSLVWEVSRNFDLAPSTMSLAGLEAPGGGLHRLQDKDRRLAILLGHLAPHYDRCFIDCPPNIGLLTYNALRAAGEALIPVETAFFALRGARKQWNTIRSFVERINHPISCYVLPTLFKKNEELAANILASIKREFGGRVIPLVINDYPQIREAASFGQPVIEYAPDSDGAADFLQLADWLDDHPADPPAIEVAVRRSVTVPYFIPGLDDPDLVSQDEPADQTQTSDESPPPPPVNGAGTRAQEMARRVQRMVEARQTPPAAQNIVAGNTPAATRTCDDASSASAYAQAPSSAFQTTTPTAETHALDAVTLAQRRRATLIESKDVPTQLALLHTNLVRLFGARQTGQGVLFLQPGAPDMHISVAGSFNGWSGTASPLRYNPAAGAHELMLPLARGEHQYRLVIDGRWQADPYNTHRTRNEFGEENNVIVVT